MLVCVGLSDGEINQFEDHWAPGFYGQHKLPFASTAVDSANPPCSGRGGNINVFFVTGGVWYYVLKKEIMT